MKIGKKDILWNYAATFFKIASSVLLMPLILKELPSGEVGIWSIFITITVFSNLFDFGFSPSFTRNVSYIFSGVSSLKKDGFEVIEESSNIKIDWGLLKGTISSMRWLYMRISLILLLLLSTFGTFYVHRIIKEYNGDRVEVYIAWILLCLINTYNLYTLYYDSLLQGRGLIKKSKQIVILGNIIYLTIASLMIILGYGLLAIVVAQTVNTLVIRYLSYRTFFDKETIKKLNNTKKKSEKEIFGAIYPNAVKIGLTVLGTFLIQRSSLIIGSLFISLDLLGSYGITIQLISVIGTMATIYPMTFQPKIAQYRIENNIYAIKDLYIKGQMILIITYLLCGGVLILFGQSILNLFQSQTALLPPSIIMIATIIAFLESNHAIAGNILLSKNEVPFFKSAIISGFFTIVLLIVALMFISDDILIMVLIPGLIQAVYQNWKWPLEVIKDLGIKKTDIRTHINNITEKIRDL